MELLGTSLIGQNRGQATTSTGHAVNPATGQSLEPAYHWASHAEIEEAVRLADAAFIPYSLVTPEKRGEFLRAIAARIEVNAAQIVERGTLETALPAARLQGEMGRTCGQLRMFADVLKAGRWVDARLTTADWERKPLPRPDLRAMLRPVGPVVVFSASNFPLAYSVAGGDTASALAAGCPVIVKAHLGHLGTSELVGLAVQEAARECGMPHGVFSMLFGGGNEIGQTLVRHPLIKAAGFTGSRAGGRALMDTAASRPEPIPVYAEMSSVNPVFILPGAMRTRSDEIATGLAGSVSLGVGQFCTCPGLVFIEAGPDADRFTESLRQRIAAVPPGTMLNDRICTNYQHGLKRMSATRGVQAVVAPDAENSGAHNQARPALFRTSAETFAANPSLMEEVFGPSTLLIHYESRPELLSVAAALEGQLTATLHGDPAELVEYRALLHVLETKAGRIVFNGFPTGVEVCDAMCHGGPYPATSDGRATAVGSRAIERFLRMISYQNCPDALLPEPLKSQK